MRRYWSLDDARRAFEVFGRVEPQLEPLWELCGSAAPPRRESVDDVYDVDAFDVDVVATDKPDNGWCAEDYFLEHVKSRLLLLVGAHRMSEPHELQSIEAYDTIYDLLINWALRRPCACCAQRVELTAAYG